MGHAQYFVCPSVKLLRAGASALRNGWVRRLPPADDQRTLARYARGSFSKLEPVMAIFDHNRTLFAEVDPATPVVIFNHSRPHARTPVFICLPAMGLAARYYAPFAEALAKAAAGVAVLADLRGQGESATLAREGARFGYHEIVAQDIPSLISAIAAQFPARPIYLVGHSLGGQLGSLATVHATPRLAGLILVASGTAHYRAWPKALQWRARITVQAVRIASTMLPWYPGRLLGFGGDQPRRFMADWRYNATTGRYRAAGSRIDYEEALHDLALPVLSVEIRGDPVAPTGATSELLAKLASCAIARRPIDGVTTDAPWKRHFSWARQPDEVVAEIVDWERLHRADVECFDRAAA
ncbi:alpha/beta fold hydrolase [Lysobacter sp. KIS68-7]|uniref:alpha/beta fold hydrolase n=1 Tax=Lysobacter sp. KIS68-7 TaxID=2904252 RepID=UPI001E2C7333|nr:alpha/beta fold hydrolase [Lysobacter sp. KIS68-7]UHQ19876.1 alpha/beta fold hydrolase [Lysobacter sp. KIS68-7]